MAIYLGTKGYLDDVAVKDITRMESEFLDFMDANHPEIGASIRDEKKITDENEAALKKRSLSSRIPLLSVKVGD